MIIKHVIRDLTGITLSDYVSISQHQGLSIGRAVCIECGIDWLAAIRPELNAAELECLRCGANSSLWSPLTTYEINELRSQTQSVR